MIASSPTDIQPVLDTIAENAARLCDSIDAQIFRMESDGYRLVASFGPIPHQPGDVTVPLHRGSLVGRVLIDRQTIHIDDPLAEPESEYPRARDWPYATAIERHLELHCCERVFQSELF